MDGVAMEPGTTMTTEADRDLILQAARDYIESWLEGDAERMGGCLHPELAKRAVDLDPDTGLPTVETITREDMVTATTAGYGIRYDKPYELSILDVFEDIATVRVFSSVYMDYLHVARFGDRWLLLNVLWQRRPGR
jgi:hypothetical protein